MVKYDIIINTILIILILTIIVVVLFGCHFKGCKYFERFENNEKKEKKETPEINNNNDLNKFEKSVLDGLSSGSINTEKLANLIKEEKFTPMNLDNIINYVEKFKGSI
jgi:hypothetical protein